MIFGRLRGNRSSRRVRGGCLQEGQLKVKLETLEELVACDPATRAVFPFQGDILPLIQQGVADLDLCDAVPEAVKRHYERSRKLFIRGFFDYELFTVAGEYAVITVEMALRERLALMLPEEVQWLYERASLHNLIEKAVKAKLVNNPAARQEFDNILNFRNHVLHGKETMLVTPDAVRPILQKVARLVDYVWRE
jgi:hypothetical protein